MEYWNRFYDWLVPQALQNQLEKRTQINILVGVFLGNIIVCLLTLVFLQVVLDLPPFLNMIAIILTSIPIVMYALALWVLRISASIVSATNVAVFGLFLDDFFAVVVTGGYSTSPLVGLFLLAPLLSFLLAGHRSGVFWSIVVIVTQFMMIYLETSGVIQVNTIVDEQSAFLLHLAMPIIICSMLVIALYIFESINVNLRHKLIGVNATLEGHADVLDKQNREITLKNDELERSRQVLIQKSEELEASGRYKSEFLSTMSHELRTPLNSILILSQALLKNKDGKLGDKELEHANVIHSAGSDLLTLINDILDLSKVEEGKMELVYENVALEHISSELDRQFKYVVTDKGLDFAINIATNLPSHIDTDMQRLSQIMKNFISNAIKFTDKGGVYVDMYRPQHPFVSMHPHLSEEKAVVFAVRDTGAGIPKEKQDLIFEAFKQADGTTSRKYGGTGLGLTISRQLASLMHGEISVFSSGEGTGSTFGLIVPLEVNEEVEMLQMGASADYIQEELVEDGIIDESTEAVDEVAMQANLSNLSLAMPSNSILIVEDDIKFARILQEMTSGEGLQCDVLYEGLDALTYLEYYIPLAIILDLSLPDISGWDVLQKVRELPHLKNVPLHIVSAMPEQKKASELGVDGFIEKPVSHDDMQGLLGQIKMEISESFNRILIVEDSIELHRIIEEQFKDRGLGVVLAETGNEALRLIEEQDFDCFIVDLNLPDYKDTQLLEKLRSIPAVARKPIIVFTAMTLNAEKEFEISRYADRVVVKSPRALDNLIETTGMFLHSFAQNAETAAPAAATESEPVAEVVPIRQEPPVFAEESVPEMVEQEPSGQYDGAALAETAVSYSQSANLADTNESDVAETEAEESESMGFVPTREYIEYEDGCLENRKVLVVDDDVRNIYSMEAVLDGIDMDVVSVMSGQEALDALNGDSGFEIILMDMMMPEMDGYEATRQLRKIAAYEKTPVIALTAKAMVGDREETLDAGCDDYVTKPVDIEHLKRVMHTWLSDQA